MTKHHGSFLILLSLLLTSLFSGGYGEEGTNGLEFKSYLIKIEGIKNPEIITVYLETEDSLGAEGSEKIFAVDQDGFLYSPFEKNKGKAREIELSYGNYLFEVIISGESETYPVSIDPTTPTATQKAISLTIKESAKTSSENVKNLREIKVKIRKEKISASREVLSGEQARLIPGTGGDILKAIANFPGVVLSSGFSSDLYIRGGSARDAIYSFDDIYIGDPYHLGGLYSVFSPIVIDKLIFYPSSFPNKFGNSQGAVTRYQEQKRAGQGKNSSGH